MELGYGDYQDKESMLIGAIQIMENPQKLGFIAGAGMVRLQRLQVCARTSRDTIHHSLADRAAVFVRGLVDGKLESLSWIGDCVFECQLPGQMVQGRAEIVDDFPNQHREPERKHRTSIGSDDDAMLI